MDVLLAMRTFRREAERNSFRLAAADLGQSTVAVSKQVRQLEERLGSAATTYHPPHEPIGGRPGVLQ